MDAKSLMLFVSAITLEVMATVLFKKGTSRLANSLRKGWLSHFDNIMNALPTIMNIVPSLVTNTKRGILIVFTIQTLVSASQTRT